VSRVDELRAQLDRALEAEVRHQAIYGDEPTEWGATVVFKTDRTVVLFTRVDDDPSRPWCRIHPRPPRAGANVADVVAAYGATWETVCSELDKLTGTFVRPDLLTVKPVRSGKVVEE
jgi:hypothetical protein